VGRMGRNKWAKNTESDMERQRFIDSTLAESTLLSELLERYEHEIAPSKRSEATIKSRIKILKEELGHYTIIHLKSSTLASYREKRTRAMSKNAARKDLQFIRALLNLADKEWGITLPHGNPVDYIRLPAENHGRDRRVSEGELNAIFKNISPNVEPIVKIAVETGMRRSEITNLEWEHINLNKRTAHIPVTKTDTPRTIPLSSRAVNILRSIPRQINGKVFWVRPKTVTAAFKRACDRAEIEGLRFHDLRHEAVSRLFEKGLNPMEVSAISGHKTLQMLKRYTHLKAEDLAKKLG